MWLGAERGLAPRLDTAVQWVVAGGWAGNGEAGALQGLSTEYRGASRGRYRGFTYREAHCASTM